MTLMTQSLDDVVQALAQSLCIQDLTCIPTMQSDELGAEAHDIIPQYPLDAILQAVFQPYDGRLPHAQVQALRQAAAADEQTFIFDNVTLDPLVLLLQHVDGQAVLEVDLHRLFVGMSRSEEHTSELQSRENLVCR